MDISNIARFINSVSELGKSNIKYIRRIYQGKPVILLYSIKDIPINTSLNYDYNEMINVI